MILLDSFNSAVMTDTLNARVQLTSIVPLVLFITSKDCVINGEFPQNVP